MARTKLTGLLLAAGLALAVAWFMVGSGGDPGDATDAVVAVSAFENLGWGLTYEEVAKALGSKGRQVEGSAGETYEWTLSDGSRRRMVFIDGRMKFISKPK